MPPSPDAVLAVVLAVALGLVGVPVGRATGRVVPLFVRHDPGPDGGSGPPPPACPHCGAEIPFLRWLPVPRSADLLRRGRCPSCRATIPVSSTTVRATAAAFAVIGATTGMGLGLAGHSWVALAALLFFGALGAVLSVIDIRVHRLPDVLVLRSYPVALPLVLGGALAAAYVGGPADRLASPEIPPADALTALAGLGGVAGGVSGALVGMAGLAAFYGLLWFIYPAGMGWGDVKLSGMLGLYLGWQSLSSVISGTFLAFLLSSAVGLTLMALGRATRKTQLPFGPFMIIGALAVVLVGDPLPLII
ncbi:A24 family peptidase [Nocardiopsis rhodophaea]|uniref:A24 family peptidase n=1 Tax=Nocardiopsis rhodophaea TaxID=280238 RepID=A0ABN2SEQ4_9ACTN